MISMSDNQKNLEPPKFLCIRDRTLVICLSVILALLSLISVVLTITKGLNVGDFIPLIFEIPVFIGAMAMTTLTLRIAKVSLVLYIILLMAYGLLYVVYGTSAMATDKIDDSLDFFFTTNTTGMFEQNLQPEELFKSSLEFGYAMEVVFIIAVSIVYLQYFLINRLLKYVRATENNRDASQP